MRIAGLVDLQNLLYAVYIVILRGLQYRIFCIMATEKEERVKPTNVITGQKEYTDFSADQWTSVWNKAKNVFHRSEPSKYVNPHL